MSGIKTKLLSFEEGSEAVLSCIREEYFTLWTHTVNVLLLVPSY